MITKLNTTLTSAKGTGNTGAWIMGLLAVGAIAYFGNKYYQENYAKNPA